jgi:hypothetical protein
LARKEEPDTIIRCLKTEERTPERCSPTADRFQTLQRVARRLRNKLNASRHSTHYFAQVFRGSSNKPSNANNPSNNNPRSGPAQRICIDRHLYPKAERAIQCREQNRGSIFIVRHAASIFLRGVAIGAYSFYFSGMVPSLLIQLLLILELSHKLAKSNSC